MKKKILIFFFINCFYLKNNYNALLNFVHQTVFDIEAFLIKEKRAFEEEFNSLKNAKNNKKITEYLVETIIGKKKYTHLLCLASLGIGIVLLKKEKSRFFQALNIINIPDKVLESVFKEDMYKKYFGNSLIKITTFILSGFTINHLSQYSEEEIEKYYNNKKINNIVNNIIYELDRSGISPNFVASLSQLNKQNEELKEKEDEYHKKIKNNIKEKNQNNLPLFFNNEESNLFHFFDINNKQIQLNNENKGNFFNTIENHINKQNKELPYFFDLILLKYNFHKLLFSNKTKDIIQYGTEILGSPLLLSVLSFFFLVGITYTLGLEKSITEKIKNNINFAPFINTITIYIIKKTIDKICFELLSNNITEEIKKIAKRHQENQLEEKNYSSHYS